MKKCKNCKSEITVKKTYCSLQCQADYEYKTRVEKWLNGKYNPLRGAGQVKNFVRKYLIELYGEKCSECGWCEKNIVTQRVPVEIDHIDGDSTNNKPENLRLICPNCHSLTSTYKNLNRGSGRHNRKTRYHTGKSW